MRCRTACPPSQSPSSPGGACTADRSCTPTTGLPRSSVPLLGECTRAGGAWAAAGSESAGLHGPCPLLPAVGRSTRRPSTGTPSSTERGSTGPTRSPSSGWTAAGS
eukprot:5461577-Lingulodinium_polyedra.AAC.1